MVEIETDDSGTHYHIRSTSVTLNENYDLYIYGNLINQNYDNPTELNTIPGIMIDFITVDQKIIFSIEAYLPGNIKNSNQITFRAFVSNFLSRCDILSLKKIRLYVYYKHD